MALEDKIIPITPYAYLIGDSERYNINSEQEFKKIYDNLDNLNKPKFKVIYSMFITLDSPIGKNNYTKEKFINDNYEKLEKDYGQENILIALGITNSLSKIKKDSVEEYKKLTSSIYQEMY